MNNQNLLNAFSKLSTPLIADACLRLKVSLRLAPAGIRAVRVATPIAGHVLPAKHYGSVDIFLEAMGAANSGDILVIANFGTFEVRKTDAVFADDDGVLFVPSQHLEKVLSTAQAIWQKERRQAEAIRAGTKLREQLRFEEYLAKRALDPSHTFRQHLRQIGGAIEE